MNKFLSLMIMYTFFMIGYIATVDTTELDIPVVVNVKTDELANEEEIVSHVIVAGVEIDLDTVVENEEEPEQLYSDEEIELIALVTMAEAEGESEEGKRLVIDTILNRVDSEQFPDTIHEVIYQPNQFSSMWNGRVDRCYVMEDICQLVREETKQRKNDDVIFFTAGNYGQYGEPLFKVGNHYFSTQG